MSSFSDIDLSKISPQKKRPLEKDTVASSAFSTSIPQALKLNDYKYPENSLNNGKKLKLPKLLSYQLPNDLLLKYNISQLSLDELNLSLNITNIQSPSASTIISTQNKKTVVKESILESNSSSISRSSSKKLSHIRKSSNIDSTLTLQESAEKLKKSAITYYVEKQYECSLLDFIQSYLLFLINLKMKENEIKELEENDISYPKFISRKGRDITTLLSFGEQMISNFSKVIRTLKQKNNNELVEHLLHLLGFIYYLNGFIEVYLSELMLKQIGIIDKDIENNTNNPPNNISQLTKYIHKYEELLNGIKENFRNGEINFGLFKIMKYYPNLYDKSLTKITSLKNNEIVLINSLNVSTKLKFRLGINYCLPINSHSWNLNHIINFGSLFLNEWCLKHSIKHSIIF